MKNKPIVNVEMNIKHKITIPITKTGDTFICNNLLAVQLLLGSSSVSGNLSHYNVKKVGKKFIIPVEVVEERSKLLQSRYNELGEKITLINEVLQSAKKAEERK